MVHAITTFNCKNGHSSDWGITYDSNECGCHDDGQPCLIIICRKCVYECTKIGSYKKLDKVYIPISIESLM